MPTQKEGALPLLLELLWVFFGFSLDFLWITLGLLWVIARFSWGSRLVLIRFALGSRLGFLWITLEASGLLWVLFLFRVLWVLCRSRLGFSLDCIGFIF